MATVRLTFEHNQRKTRGSALAFTGSEIDALIRAWKSYGFKLVGYVYVKL